MNYKIIGNREKLHNIAFLNGDCCISVSQYSDKGRNVIELSEQHVFLNSVVHILHEQRSNEGLG